MNEDLSEIDKSQYYDETMYKKLYKFFKNKDIFMVLLYIFLMHLPPSYVFILNTLLYYFYNFIYNKLN